MKYKKQKQINLPNVLFIDDNRANNFLMETIIKLDKIQIIPHFADDAFEAISYLRRMENTELFPAFMFVDINMPMKDGFEFLDDFLKEFPEYSELTKIYILTTTVTKRDRNKAANYEIIIDCIEKPLEAIQLKQIMTSFGY